MADEEPTTEARWVYIGRRLTQKEISRQFGVSCKQVSVIASRKQWAHI